MFHSNYTCHSIVPFSFTPLSLVGHLISEVSSERFITDLSGLLQRVYLFWSFWFHFNAFPFPLWSLPRHSRVIFPICSPLCVQWLNKGGLLHPQTSQTSQSRVDKCRTTTNVTINGGQTSHHPLTSQTLRTTNVTKHRNMFCAHFQVLKCYSFTSTVVCVLSLKW